MNWFKKLFGIVDRSSQEYDGLPLVKNVVPMPEVKLPRADKDISEPIISFVKCVQENPKRFKVLYDYEFNELTLVFCLQGQTSGTKRNCRPLPIHI
jgi:hypothetical protein